MDFVETWLTTGELNAAMLADNFRFISPFWKGNNKKDFVAKFQDASAYKETSLSKIIQFDPVIQLESSDKNNFSIILQYHTRNGNKVYEAVLYPSHLKLR